MTKAPSNTKKEFDRLYDFQERIRPIYEVWTPTKKQSELIGLIFEDGFKRVFVRGGRKSSKTETFIAVATLVAAVGNDRVVSIIGPTLKQQKKILWNNRRLQNFIPPSWNAEIRIADNMIRFPWGSFIEVDGSENADAHRGEEQDLLVLDELKDHETDSYEAMYPNLAARDGILLAVGSPPKHKNNLYYELEMRARQDPRWKILHWRCWDNATPNGHVSRRWLEEEKAAYERRGDSYLWEIEYEGRYVFGGKDAVFSVFDEHKHVLPHDALMAVIEKDKHHLDYFIVSDPGNRVCHANLFIAYDRVNSLVWVLDEVYETLQAETATGKIVPRILEKANELFPRNAVPFWIYDEAALWFQTEVYAQFPDVPPMMPTQKAVKEKETSMGVIKDCMSMGRYVQSDRCKSLKEEIIGYYLDSSGKYVKINDHAIDSLRYFFDFVGYSYELTPLTERERELEGRILSPHKGNMWAGDDLGDVNLDDEDLIWN